MKRILLILLVVIIALGALAGAGFAGFRMGFERGVATQDDGEPRFFVERFHKDEIPGLPLGVYPHDRGFDRGFGGPIGFHGRNFGSPISFLLRIAILGLIVWLVYMLFKGNGWQLTFTRIPAQSRPADSVDVGPAASSDEGKQ